MLILNKNIMKKHSITTEKIFDDFYLIILCLYYIKAFFGTTLFYILWPKGYDNFLNIIIIGYVFLKAGYIEYRGKKWMVCIAISLIFLLSWLSTGYWFLFHTAFLMIGAIDVYYKKILKVYLKCGLSIIGLAVIGSMMGCIRDLVYMEGSFYKHSFGIIYPTDFAAYLVYFSLIFWVLYESISPFLFSAILFLLVIFQYYFCGTQCSEIVMLLLICGVFYDRLASFMQDKCVFATKLIYWIDQLLSVFIIFCAGIMIWISIQYNANNTILKTINKLLSGRLRLAQNAINMYGIKLFGTAFQMIGNGGETISHPDYNFVDSSYCLLLVRYGLAVLVIVCFLYFLIQKKAHKNKMRKLMIAFALISVHCMIEHHLLDLTYNPLFLLAFADMDSQYKEEVSNIHVKAYINRIGCSIPFILFLLVLVVPRVRSYGKTIVTLLHLNNSNMHLLFIALISILGYVIWVLIKEIASIIIEKSYKYEIIYLKCIKIIGCLTTVFLFFLVMENYMNNKTASYQQSINAGKEIIEILKKNKCECKIYVDDIPEIYRRQVNGISYRFAPIDSAASEKVFIITNTRRDVFRLIQAGCLFAEISEFEAIYTNDELAIRILNEKGIDMSTCYNVRKEVNLKYLAEENGLKLSDNKGLVVEGEEKSLIHGPYDVIYNGRLQVEYKLKLLNASLTDNELGRVRLSYNYGKNIVGEKEITRDDFDEDGYGTVVVEGELPSSAGVEYLLFAYGNAQIEIESITYGKIEYN